MNRAAWLATVHSVGAAVVVAGCGSSDANSISRKGRAQAGRA